MTDDEQMQRLQSLVDWRTQRAEAVELANLKESFAASQPSRRGAPFPLDWHPFYRGNEWLMEWLDGQMPSVGHVVRVPLERPVSSWFPEKPGEPIDPRVSMQTLTLTKHTAWAPAPYVGRPFVYAWEAASDEYGRWIAGSARIEYIDGQPHVTASA